MKPPKPINIHSLRGLTINAASVATRSPFTRPKMKTEWKKIRHTRRCPQCKGKLDNVIAFRETPISFCDDCQCEVEL